jgi:hypothetical protein
MLTKTAFAKRWTLSLLAVVILLTGASKVTAQASRTAGMDKARMIGEAETLAEACRLRLNKPIQATLRADALSRINGSTFYSMERFAQAYTLNILKHDRSAACARALTQFGSKGVQIRDLLLTR